MKNIIIVALLIVFTISVNAQKVDSFISKDGTEIFFQEFGDKGKTIVFHIWFVHFHFFVFFFV